MEVAMQSIRTRAVVIAAALILPVSSLPSQAGFKVCNKTKETVDVAVAYVNPAGGFISEGWFTFRPCEPCGQLVNSGDTSDPHNYFFYAKSRQGSSWTGDSFFCTRSGSAFKFKNAQQCIGGGEKKGFKHVASPSGNHSHSLTSASSSCGVIIDD
jgi:uncharacterized membrane protein